jgi:hypothetical protein
MPVRQSVHLPHGSPPTRPSVPRRQHAVPQPHCYVAVLSVSQFASCVHLSCSSLPVLRNLRVAGYVLVDACLSINQMSTPQLASTVNTAPNVANGQACLSQSTAHLPIPEVVQLRCLANHAWILKFSIPIPIARKSRPSAIHSLLLWVSRETRLPHGPVEHVPDNRQRRTRSKILSAISEDI